jgi:hypothetical protein
MHKAIIDANNKVHLYQERTLLETIELLMMLGDPHFDDDNQLDWNRLIASCLPNAENHYLEDSVQVLRTISRKFEDLTVFSSLFQVSGSLPNGRKGLRFRKKSKLGGCLCDATVSVRLFTTQAEDADIPGLPGNGKVCAFCPTSSHHITLLEAGDEKNILAHRHYYLMCLRSRARQLRKSISALKFLVRKLLRVTKPLDCVRTRLSL